MKTKVGVIFGGKTVEHEISIITAIQAMGFIDQEKYEIIPIYISKERVWYTGKMLLEIDVYKDFESLKRYAKKVCLVNRDGHFFLQTTTGLFRKDIEEIDIAFPIVHGHNAEDGTLQGYLDTIGIPYVGSGVLGSALAQDKVVMKQIMKSEGLPYVPYVWFFDYRYFEQKEEVLKEIQKLGYPVIVKPASLGSSVGITVVQEESKIDAAIMDAIQYDSKIVVEKWLDHITEVNCAVIGTYDYQEASLIDEIIPYHNMLTYEDKYIGGGKKGMAKSSGVKGMASAERIIPAPIGEVLTKQIEELSKKAFRIFNCGGVVRFDFILDHKTQEVYINEPNNIPGSLAFYLFEPKGKSYSKLLDEMLTFAIKDYKYKNKKISSFDTNILSMYSGGVKGTKGMKSAKLHRVK